MSDLNLSNWEERLVAPESILNHIKPGMTIFIGTGPASPRTLITTLLDVDIHNIRDLATMNTCILEVELIIFPVNYKYLHNTNKNAAINLLCYHTLINCSTFIKRIRFSLLLFNNLSCYNSFRHNNLQKINTRFMWSHIYNNAGILGIYAKDLFAFKRVDI